MMDVTVHKREGEHVIALSGDLTTQAEGPVMAAVTLAITSSANISIDLSHVEYLNSGGIAILIGVVQEAKKHGRSMKLLNPDQHHMRIFKMIGLARFVTIESDPSHQPAPRMERRSSDRRLVSMPVAVSVEVSHGTGQWSCMSRDISTTGIFLLTDRSIRTGAPVNLEFTLPGEQSPLKINGNIIRLQQADEEHPAGLGIKFQDSASIPEAIRRYIGTIGTMVDP